MKKLTLTLIFLFPLTLGAASAVIEVDTNGETINALEGSILLPQTGMTVREAQTGNSVILIWVEGPTIFASAKAVVFSGVTPGGFSGKSPIMTLVGDFSTSSVSQIRFQDIRALKNDGAGTEVEVSLSARLITDTTDEVKPEPFDIQIGRSEDVLLGKRFATFLAQDKQSGVLRYEARESWIFGLGGNWQVAKSPYEIQDKILIKRLYIKAVDHAGNERVESTPLPNRKYLLLFVAILIVATCVTLLRRSRDHLSSPYSS